METTVTKKTLSSQFKTPYVEHILATFIKKIISPIYWRVSQEVMEIISKMKEAQLFYGLKLKVP